MSYQSGSCTPGGTGSLDSPRRDQMTSSWSSTRPFNLSVLGSLLAVGIVAFASGSLWQRGGVQFDSENSKTQTITVQLEGKKHDNSRSKSGSDKVVETHLLCDDGKYSKRTLKLAYELPFASLFKDTKGQRKYEASSVVVVDDSAYAICDSSWAISKFNRELQPFNDANIQIGDPGREEEDSGYEALIHDNGTFYVVRESIQHEDSTYHAIIEELELGDDDYDIKAQCSAEFAFEGDSKGTKMKTGGSASKQLVCLIRTSLSLLFPFRLTL